MNLKFDFYKNILRNLHLRRNNRKEMKEKLKFNFPMEVDILRSRSNLTFTFCDLQLSVSSFYLFMLLQFFGLKKNSTSFFGLKSFPKH